MTAVRLRPGPAGAALELRTGALAPRVLTAGPTSARVALVGTRALLLGGDDVRLDVAVEEGCLLELVEVAGTVAYDGRGAPASWTVRVRLAAGARLVWHGEPFVVSAGADVTRRLDVDLAPGAVACLRETLVLGRAGEEGGRVLSGTRARLAGAALLADDLDLRSADVRRSPAVLGASRCVDSLLLLGARRQEAGSLQLDGPGTVLRWLGRRAHESPLAAAWARWSASARAEAAVAAT